MLTSSSMSSFLTFNGRAGAFLRERIACRCRSERSSSSSRSHGFVVFAGGNRKRNDIDDDDRHDGGDMSDLKSGSTSSFLTPSDAASVDSIASVAASSSTGSSPSFSASPRTSPTLRSRRKTRLSDCAFHLATPMVVRKNIFSTSSFSSRSSSSSSSSFSSSCPSSSYPLLWSQRGRRLLGGAFQFRFAASSSGRKSFSSSTPSWRPEDPYAALELSPSATPKEIKDAFYRLSKKYHPDLHPGDKGAEESFKAVSAAYNILGDAATKSQYDREAAQAAQAAGPSRASNTGGQDRKNADWQYVDIERMMREQEEAWRKMNKREYEQMMRDQEKAWQRMKAAEEKYGPNAGGFGRFRPPFGPEPPPHERERLFRDFGGGGRFGRQRKQLTQEEVAKYFLLISFLYFFFSSFQGDLRFPYD